MATNSKRRKIDLVFKCSTSTHEAEHIWENPVMLSCGHNICQACLTQALQLPGMSHSFIKCNICDKKNTRNLDEHIKEETFSLMFDLNLNELFEITYQRFKDNLKTCKDWIYNYEERIDTQIQFIKDEIQIRIESIKMELDKLYDSFSIELDGISDTWKSEMKKIEFDKFSEETEKIFQKELEQLKENIKEQKDLNEESLYKYQNKIKEVQEILKQFKEKIPSLNYRESKIKVERNLIADLIFDTKQDKDKNIIDRIKANVCQQKNVGCCVSDICELVNGHFVLTSYNDGKVLLCNRDMELLKQITVIGDRPAKVKAVTTGNNNIFLCLNVKTNKTIGFNFTCFISKIVKTDLSLNISKIWDSDYGSIGICYYNRHIYICQTNRQIKILSEDLTEKSYERMEYEPRSIKNINNIAIVVPVEERSIYFHDLNNSFRLLKKYENRSGIIGASTLYFYQYDSYESKFYCYNKECEQVEEIKTECDRYPVNSSGSICIGKSKLYLTSYNTLSIV